MLQTRRGRVWPHRPPRETQAGFGKGLLESDYIDVPLPTGNHTANSYSIEDPIDCFTSLLQTFNDHVRRLDPCGSPRPHGRHQAHDCPSLGASRRTMCHPAPGDGDQHLVWHHRGVSEVKRIEGGTVICPPRSHPCLIGDVDHSTTLRNFFLSGSEQRSWRRRWGWAGWVAGRGGGRWLAPAPAPYDRCGGPFLEDHAPIHRQTLPSDHPLPPTES